MAASVPFPPVVSKCSLSPTSSLVSLVTCFLMIAIPTKVRWNLKVRVLTYFSPMAKDVNSQDSFISGTPACSIVLHTL